MMGVRQDLDMPWGNSKQALERELDQAIAERDEALKMCEVIAKWYAEICAMTNSGTPQAWIDETIEAARKEVQS